VSDCCLLLLIAASVSTSSRRDGHRLTCHLFFVIVVFYAWLLARRPLRRSYTNTAAHPSFYGPLTYVLILQALFVAPPILITNEVWGGLDNGLSSGMGDPGLVDPSSGCF
jgi:hypothetical protein